MMGITQICRDTLTLSGVKIGASKLSQIMSSHTITLSEHTYQSLLEVAEKQGLTPENWILSQLDLPQSEAEPLSEKIGDLIGAIDSQLEPHHQFQSTDFGEQIATKLSKQGLQRP
jgi:cell division ATPase FtsA